MLACLWLLIQFVSQASALDSATAGRPAGDAVVAVVAIAVLTASRDVAASPSSPQPPSAPGVTRTPGQRFRKPLLYPPELQGRKPRNVEGLRIGEQGLNACGRQSPAATQELELDQEAESGELGSTVRHQLAGCLGSASRRQDV